MPEADVFRALTAGVELDIVPMIKIVSCINEFTAEAITSLPAESTVVFTSANAVYAVSSLGKGGNWKVYCLLGATAIAVAVSFPDAVIAGTAADSAGLAPLVAESAAGQTVTFFCGDKRMSTLSDGLKEEGITVNEIEVYQTQLTGKLVGRYNAILMLSPSAVDAYFAYNKPDADTALFAIGNTTADAIKAKGINNNIVIASRPDRSVLLKEAIEYIQH